MTVRISRLRAPLTVCATLLLVVLAGCSGDDEPDAPPRDRTGDPSAPGSYGEVRPDISPQGYAALGCSLHASQRVLDPTELINRRDPRDATFSATWPLLVAAGVWNDEAYGALVEPASGLQFTHPQGDGERVADQRAAVTRACEEVARVAVGPHVAAAYSCRILDRVVTTAPSLHDLAPDRLTTAVDELDASLELARAAAAEEEDYGRLGRRAARVQEAVAAEKTSAVYEDRRQEMVEACGQLDRAAGS